VMKTATALFFKLMYDFRSECWNELELPKLSLRELLVLAKLLGCPSSGSKETVICTNSAGMKCQKTFGQDRTQNRKESCCGRSLASDRISAKNAWPRARHRSRQFNRPAESARLLPDRQIPASRHISRSDSPALQGCLQNETV
jgi:hypothetical protein